MIWVLSPLGFTTGKFIWLYYAEMSPEDADGTANSVDSDQTVLEQSDLGLHCLLRLFVPVHVH